MKHAPDMPIAATTQELDQLWHALHGTYRVRGHDHLTILGHPVVEVERWPWRS